MLIYAAHLRLYTCYGIWRRCAYFIVQSYFKPSFFYSVSEIAGIAQTRHYVGMGVYFIIDSSYP